jgi:hypothetical protein
MRKILEIVVALLVGSVSIVVAVGYALPRKHVTARAISLRQQPADVFTLVSNFKEEPAWRADVQSVEFLSPVDGRVSFREKGKNGDITMEVVESNSPARLVTRIADPNLPFGGAWIFDIAATSVGCRLNITERGEVYNPVFRFVSRFILGHTGTLDTYLGSVARRFGESSTPEPGTPAAE